MPFAPILLLIALLHGYIGLRLVPALPGPPGFGLLLVAALLASAVLLPFSLLARRIRRQPLSDLMAWAGSLATGLFSSLLVLTVLRDAILIGAALFTFVASWVLPAAGSVAGSVVGSIAESIAVLRVWSAAAVPLLGLAVTLWGLVNARRTAAVVRVDVPIDGLPAALHGFRIAQISDVHIGPTIKRGYVQAIVDAVNRLDADLVAVTGDLVDGSVQDLKGDVAPLAALASRHGTYFVTGNHEYYSGAPAWVFELRRLGLNVLMNEHVVLRHGAADLVLAGVTDFQAHHFDPTQRSDPHAALVGAPAGAGARVLLAHQPRSAEAAAQAGFDLQLSGHTHGGQFLPWNLFVRLQQPFTAGLDRLRTLWVYTSRGTGYWGPPNRFGAPSEITHLRLVAGRPVTA